MKKHRILVTRLELSSHLPKTYWLTASKALQMLKWHSSIFIKPDAPPEETVSASLQQAVKALNPHPTYVIGRRWDLLTWNRAAELVFSFSDIAPPHSRNFIWRSFTNPVLRMHRNWEKLAQSLIAQFRADCARYPGDPWFGELIEDLKQNSEEFNLWWSRHDVKRIPDGHKLMDHQKLGILEFEHVTLEVPVDADQKVIIYTCSSETSSKLIQLLSEN